MSLIVLFCLASMAASAPSKTDEKGNYGNVVSINMMTNPVRQGKHDQSNSSNNSGSMAKNSGTMDMLAALKDEVRNLGDNLVEAITDLQLPTCTVDTSLICEKSILNGTEHPTTDGRYSPANVLIDSCDDPTDPHDPATIDWWSTPVEATGDYAFFVVDLGCSKCVSKVTLTNSGNGSSANRSTKGFLVSVATESNPAKWIPVVRGTLADVRGTPCEEQPGKQTFKFAARKARFAKFEVISFFGRNGNLQYFDMS